VDKLTVIICHKTGQVISGELRAAWILEMVPGVETKVVADIYAADDSKAWAEYTLRILGYAPDIVFTSEDYGTKYCEYMGSRHVLVDIERNTVPISASKIRGDPLKYWDYLDPPVRAYFARRVCVIGAESTGTTTMAIDLADHYQTTLVPEFGRAYYEAKIKSQYISKWDTSEFIFIAQQQNRIEDQLAGYSNKLLICDTDSFATSLWHERYVGYLSCEVDSISYERHYDLYLLTDKDFPFVQDGTRDGDQIRLHMHGRFVQELDRRNKPTLLLSGTHEERLNKAIEACDNIMLHIKPI
jgi:NadR type nicotinamide-nucleotide adenylyltransferase